MKEISMFKKIALVTLVTISFAQASVEAQQRGYVHPSTSEIEQKRACFQDLEIQGCGNHEADHAQFRSCLSNVVESLDPLCKKMMLELYGE